VHESYIIEGVAISRSARARSPVAVFPELRKGLTWAPGNAKVDRAGPTQVAILVVDEAESPSLSDVFNVAKPVLEYIWEVLRHEIETMLFDVATDQHLNRHGHRLQGGNLRGEPSTK
jgi:hypothetical protein